MPSATSRQRRYMTKGEIDGIWRVWLGDEHLGYVVLDDGDLGDQKYHVMSLTWSEIAEPCKTQAGAARALVKWHEDWLERCVG